MSNINNDRLANQLGSLGISWVIFYKNTHIYKARARADYGFIFIILILKYVYYKGFIPN